jgi:hypothetical protein
MKVKVTSLVLVVGAFIVGILTQDGSLNIITGSRALTAFILFAWFGILGAGLYFWTKYTRQQAPKHGAHPTQADESSADESSSLRQLVQAIGPSKTVSTAESDAKPEAAPQKATRKDLR